MTGNNSVLITGGFGNLGSWLATWFIEKGYEVSLLGHHKRDFLPSSDFRWIPCDITDAAQCEAVLANKDFRYIIHTASVNDTFVEDYAKKALLVNTLGTRNLLQALNKDPLKNFVYLSTFHVYGLNSGIISEETPVKPRHDYATTHLFAEFYVKQFHLTHSLPFTILRLTNSYGCPKEKDSSKWYLVLNDLARMAYEKKEIVLNSNGQAQRDFIWMGTVCEAIGSILKLPAPNEVFNLGSGITFRLLDVAGEVQKAYAEMYGDMLPIRVNEQDKSQHTDLLKVQTAKIAALVQYDPQNKFKDEAKNIFRFLEKMK